MIYLLGQMSFIILLALIAGGALGWGFHRLRNSQNVAEHRRVIMQQQQHVKQAQTEVSMLSQDYDELKQKSSSTIDALRGENRQIPNLHQNLEKSQLLVRQLMQKHEAQIREYATENETLKTKVKTLTDRENALNKLQSDVERERRVINEARKAAGDAPLPDSTINSALASTTTSGSAAKSSATQQTTTYKPTSSESSGSAKTSSEQLSVGASASADASVKAGDAKGVNQGAAATSDSQKTDVKNTSGASKNTASANKKNTQQTIAELTAMAQAKAKKDRATGKDAASYQSDDEDALDMSADVTGEAGSLTVALAEADMAIAGFDKKQEGARTIEDDEVIDTSEIGGEMEFADDEDSSLLFDPVDQHDDLQTIFGIGPIFERSLNRLGITSYSQLAELKRHDIEKLAVALEIMPGKIERENWVGNARRQLEDVLEEL